MGRATQGVRLISLRGKDAIAAVCKVPKSDEEDELVEGLEGGAEGGTTDAPEADASAPEVEGDES
jgi:DNA gyrase subunit A